MSLEIFIIAALIVANGVFAMAGGYLMITAMNQLGLPWLPALIVACIAVALGISLLLGRAVTRP